VLAMNKHRLKRHKQFSKKAFGNQRSSILVNFSHFTCDFCNASPTNGEYKLDYVIIMLMG
jgi:hypothetical protein